MKQAIPLQWRLTITTMALITVACALLTVLLSRSALLQLDHIENTVVQISTLGDAPLEIGVGVGDLMPDLAKQLQESRSMLLLFGTLSMAAVILAVGACTYFFTGRALQPLRQLSSRMETVQAQNLSQPLDVPNSGDELARLSRSFNGMLSRLDAAFESQRQFSANAAHELRTPLAVIQADLEVLARYKEPAVEQYVQTFAMVQEQTGRLGQLVKVLLEMTQMETIERGDVVSFSALIEEVLCDLVSVAEDKQITLSQGPGEVQVTGSDLLLYRAVYNLVENAIKYNRPGGSVTVSCERRSGLAVITVADTGGGIPKEDWEKIFEPFFRVDKSRSRQMGGAGLGLAMVRKIAEGHGGTAQVIDSSAQGTVIEFRVASCPPLHESFS